MIGFLPDAPNFARSRNIPTPIKRNAPNNTVRPHASLGFLPPAPEVFIPTFAAWPAAQSRPASPATPHLSQEALMNKQHSTWTTQWRLVSHRHVLLGCILAKKIVGDNAEALVNCLLALTGYFRLGHNHRRIVADLDITLRFHHFIFCLFNITHNRPLCCRTNNRYTRDSP